MLRPLQIGHVVDHDGDELPAFVADFGEEVEVGFLTRQVGEIDFAVFPLGIGDSRHFSNRSARKTALEGDITAFNFGLRRYCADHVDLRIFERAGIRRLG